LNSARGKREASRRRKEGEDYHYSFLTGEKERKGRRESGKKGEEGGVELCRLLKANPSKKGGTTGKEKKKKKRQGRPNSGNFDFA